MTPKYSDKHADTLVARGRIIVLRSIRTKPRIFTSPPRCFDKQSGLRIHHLCLLRRDIKEERIKPVYVIDKAAIVVNFFDIVRKLMILPSVFWKTRNAISAFS